ncbi:hypothetical protein NFI96_007793 [Prochilodus magdalenae]|nr:hypothetical protein NFI96_007793 [Prochilodus magdalenae]
MKPTYRQLLKRDRATVRTVHVWPEGAESVLQDCFQCTDWEMFKSAATTDSRVGINEYATPVTGFVFQQTNQICILPNQKPWVNSDVRSLLKARDAAFASGNSEELRAARQNLKAGIRAAKLKYSQITAHFNTNSVPMRMWQGIQVITDYKSQNLLILIGIHASLNFNKIPSPCTGHTAPQHDGTTTKFYCSPKNMTEAQRGTDVTLSCEASRLPESSTLQWEREGASTPNITLFLNNTAYIILYSVDHRSQGTYTCKLKHNGEVQMHGSLTVNVTEYTYSMKSFVLYRESSNSSGLVLICRSKTLYDKIIWKKQPEWVMIAAEKGQKPKVNGSIQPGIHSSTSYDGNEFIFHVSPVQFNYNGTYACAVNNETIYSRITLHTVRVSAEPPDGVLRDQSVVLTCEVSNPTDQATMAWLSMKGNNAVLVKQIVLTNSRRTLKVTLEGLSEEQLLWQCAVFNESTLRALAPIKIRLLSAQSGEGAVAGSSLRTVIIIACVVAACVALMLGTLLVYCQRKSAADGGHVTMLKPEEEEEELHYATVTVMGVCHGAGGNARKKTPPSGRKLRTIKPKQPDMLTAKRLYFNTPNLKHKAYHGVRTGAHRPDVIERGPLGSGVPKSGEAGKTRRRDKRGRHAHLPLHVGGSAVEVVSSYRYLGVHLSNNLTWSNNTSSLVRKAHQRLYFLRRLRRAGLGSSVLTSFYRCVVESVLCSSINVWHGSCSAADRKALQRVVKAAQSPPPLSFSLSRSLSLFLCPPPTRWGCHDNEERIREEKRRKKKKREENRRKDKRREEKKEKEKRREQKKGEEKRRDETRGEEKKRIEKNRNEKKRREEKKGIEKRRKEKRREEKRRKKGKEKKKRREREKKRMKRN